MPPGPTSEEVELRWEGRKQEASRPDSSAI